MASTYDQQQNDELEFKPNGFLTLGAELELQLVDEDSHDLTSKSIEIMEELDDSLSTRVHPEIYQSMLEIVTGICKDVHEVESDLANSIQAIEKVATSKGVRLAAAGTHPFTDYHDTKLYPKLRYAQNHSKMGWVTHRSLIFGMHLHIGMRSGNECIDYMNFLSTFLPHLLGLSVSSPFWQGHDTGLLSARSTVYHNCPSAGQLTQLFCWEDFASIYNTLKRCGTIDSMKDMKWDMRPAPHYGTLEIRIIDGPTTLSELTSIAALIHTLCHWYHDNREIFPSMRNPLWIRQENKWRVMRHGLNTNILMNDGGEQIPLKAHLRSWIKKLESRTKDLGYEGYMDTLEQLMSKGTSAERQFKVYKMTKSVEAVTKHICDEFAAGHPIYPQSTVSSSKDATMAAPKVEDKHPMPLLDIAPQPIAKEA